jgi:cyclophilin family peptidyl-prolyl cis-trans isomerase
MKNLLYAVIGLIIVIVAVFLFTSKRNSTGDTVIPSPELTSTPTPNLSNVDLNATNKKSEKMKLPFDVLGADKIRGKIVKISTDKGDVVIELSADAPIASSNFIYLVNKKFYDGIIFHRVIKGFMIQGGDPNGTGSGGPGYNFEDELDPGTGSYKKGYVRGAVAMANAGPNTNGSQFFIMHQDYQLPHSYTIFASVISGMDVVDAIANSQVEGDRPLQPVVMKNVTIE